jgi:hypothetical protein
VTIDSFTAFVYDNSSADGIAVGLVRKEFRAASLGTDMMAQVNTNSDSPDIQELTTTNLAAGTDVVDNATYAYNAQACWSYTGLNAGVIRLNGATVGYTHP